MGGGGYCYYRPPEGGRLYDMKVVTRQASADSFLITPRPSDVKRHWTGLFLGLNLEKKMAAPVSMLTTSTIDGCDFDNPLQLFRNP